MEQSDSNTVHNHVFTVIAADDVVETGEDDNRSEDGDNNSHEGSGHDSDDNGDEMPRLEPIMGHRLSAIQAALRASLRDPDEGKPHQESLRDIVTRVAEATTKDDKPDSTTVDRDDLHDALQCAVCQDPMYKPTTLLCQHSFCLGCLESNQSRKCPVCRMNYVLPVEYNHSMDEVVAKCFPEAHRRAKAEEELHNHAKDARTRIEEELRRDLFRQAAAHAHVEVNEMQENRRDQPAPQAARANVAPSNNIWDRVKMRVPKYMAEVIFNPGNVVELLYRTSRYGTFIGLGTLASLFTLVLTVKEFSRFAAIFITFFILAQLGLTACKGVVWFALRAIRQTMMKAVRDIREEDQAAAARQNRPAPGEPVIFAGGFGPNGIVFPPGQQPPPELRNMLNALNSLAQGMHAHHH